jgi:DNA mismatch endonuclease (patch repair protein)
MVDILSPQDRSDLMRRIRPTGNRSTELAVARVMRRLGMCGWRRHRRIAVGVVGGGNNRGAVRPDFVFSAQRVAVFIDGCFWHCCPKHATMPATNRAWWRSKLVANVQRDARHTRLLRRHGWSVLRIWEHDVKADPLRCGRRIAQALKRQGNLRG